MVSQVTVAVVSPLAAVGHGVASMLSERADEIEVVDLRARRPDLGEADPDVILYDGHALVDGDGADLARLVATTTSVVLAIRHDLRPELGAEAMARGAHGSIDISTSRGELVDAVLGAARDGRPTRDVVALAPVRLGQSVGLTPRETDILTRITQGLSNQEIAEQSYLSINSVKTYIRSAYRRIGVTSRAQAVVWCIQNGFSTERSQVPASASVVA